MFTIIKLPVFWVGKDITNQSKRQGISFLKFKHMKINELNEKRYFSSTITIA